MSPRYRVVIKPGKKQNRTSRGRTPVLLVLFLQFWFTKHFKNHTIWFIVSSLYYFLAVINKVSHSVVSHKYFQLKPTVLLCKKTCKPWISTAITLTFKVEMVTIIISEVSPSRLAYRICGNFHGMKFLLSSK